MSRFSEHDFAEILDRLDSATGDIDQANRFWNYLKDRIAPVNQEEAMNAFAAHVGKVQEHAIKVTLHWAIDRLDGR